MQYIWKTKKYILLLYALIAIGIIFRFYNINWGAPFYFHPDERNIAGSISQLRFPGHMNPGFFAYGSLPLYLVFFINLIINFFVSCKKQINDCSVTFEQGIIGLRIIAAICSVLIIPLLYLVGKQLGNKKIGIAAAFFATTSIGFIQFAHFGTYEMWLTFFSTAMFSSCLWYMKTKTKIPLLILSLCVGILCSSKITMLILITIPIFILISSGIKDILEKKGTEEKLLQSMRYSLQLLFFFIVVTIIYIVTNPYTFLDKTSFVGSMQYESSVALGTERVFYTSEFYNTFPIIFQFLHVYPFLLNPILLLCWFVSVIYLFYRITKYKHRDEILLICFFLFLALSQAFFFVKWVRYYIPTLPFIYLMIAITAYRVFAHAKKHSNNMFRHIQLFYGISILACCLFSFCFFITVFVQPDTRISAALFAKDKFSATTPIISDVYDLGITPFNPYFSNISLFNFYDLDYNIPESSPNVLKKDLQTTDVIILPSQRIMKVRLIKPQRFPNGNEFYTDLFSGKLGYQLIYETPCDIFCVIAYAGNPVFNYEETANVFDRPVVFIFKKMPSR